MDKMDLNTDRSPMRVVDLRVTLLLLCWGCVFVLCFVSGCLYRQEFGGQMFCVRERIRYNQL